MQHSLYSQMNSMQNTATDYKSRALLRDSLYGVQFKKVPLAKIYKYQKSEK